MTTKVLATLLPFFIFALLALAVWPLTPRGSGGRVSVRRAVAYAWPFAVACVLGVAFALTVLDTATLNPIVLLFGGLYLAALALHVLCIRD